MMLFATLALSAVVVMLVVDVAGLRNRVEDLEDAQREYWEHNRHD